MVEAQLQLEKTNSRPEQRASLADRGTPLWRADGAAFLLLVAFAVAVPFPYGAVTPVATYLLTGSAFTIAALTFASRSIHQRIGAAAIPLGALLLLAGLGALQLIPLPMAMLRRWAPLSAKVYADANEILSLFNRRPVAAKISIAPEDTTATILLVLAYVAIATAAAILCGTRIRRRILIGALLASSTAHLIYAIATTAPSQRLHGAFINPNHFAGYLEIALAFAFGLIWRELLHSRERANGVREVADRFERRAIALAWPIVLWALIAAGIGLTRSRGGILASIITTLVLVLLASLHRAGRARVAAVPALLTVLAGVALVAFTTGETALLRFLASDPREIGSDQRVDLWRASIRAWHLSPTFGSGLGTFREVFRRVQPASIEGLVEQAHNDFLQMLVTGGWVAALLVAIAFAAMLAILVRAWLRQPHREESAFALAGIGAMISLILHGVVEFNMSIPAIPATLAVMIGLAWRAANEPARTVTLRAADRES